MPHLGPMEIGLILLIVLLIFGAGKLPQVFGAIGKGLREFRKGQAGEYDNKSKDARATTKKKEPVPRQGSRQTRG